MRAAKEGSAFLKAYQNAEKRVCRIRQDGSRASGGMQVADLRALWISVRFARLKPEEGHYI
jgi:hypothetical protein